MAGNRHAAAMTPDNEEMADFLKKREPETNKLVEMRERLAAASYQPDIKPGEQLARAEPAQRAPVVQQPQFQPQPRPVEAPPTARMQPTQPPVDIRSDDMSYSIPPVEPPVNRGGRPLMGKERKVERTVSMDKTLDKLVERLSNYEGVRTDKNISTASVCVHLMLYALSHVTDNAVFPTEDGKGLVITPPAEGDQGLVVNALRDILIQASKEAAQ